MKTKTTSHHGRGVERFLAPPGADVTGVIEGCDRLRLRGSLRHLYQPTFMFRYSCSAGVLLECRERWFLTADGAEIADKTCRAQPDGVSP